MMRILLTGSNGFLGQKLTDLIVDLTDYTLFCTSASANRNPNTVGYHFVDAAIDDFQKIEEIICEFRPTHIIHTAAISSVDVCEKDPDRCQSINVDAVAHLGQLAQKDDIHLTFLSTDFVFDGQNGPYSETDDCNPCNAYGASKVQAEEALTASRCRHAVLRTILVYGIHADPNRSNLVLWAKGKLESRESINVVNDQWRMPTWVDDLAKACLFASEQQAQGIFHISGGEMMTVLEIAQRVAEYWSLDMSLINSVSAKEIGQDKNRPQRTGFVLDKAKQILGYNPTPFLDSLQQIDKQFNQYR